MSIGPEERGLAAITHLSGLAGYIIPFGGVLVPIIIWIVKKDSAIISSIAKQAILLNVIAFLMIFVLVAIALTIILIPVAIIGGIVLFLGAIALPIIGAVKANDGIYYKYPMVGIMPMPTLKQA
ncbi:MAG TPA: DUF4870 domain-containing protein [Vicinamibacterales bacterium]|nr:DUF4870 domain-containing protein [Vicinamibacterales bacterium]